MHETFSRYHWVCVCVLYRSLAIVLLCIKMITLERGIESPWKIYEQQMCGSSFQRYGNLSEKCRRMATERHIFRFFHFTILRFIFPFAWNILQLQRKIYRKKSSRITKTVWRRIACISIYSDVNLGKWLWNAVRTQKYM